uniref:Portal protein n=1 Tax=viral metagenome TaxID=1070528 RepID=A0A6M3IY47_9ZZZZ
MRGQIRGTLPQPAWWDAVQAAAEGRSARGSEEQSLTILARQRDPKRVTKAALAAVDAAFGSKAYRHFRQNYLMAWEMVRGNQWPPHMFAQAADWKVRVTRNKLFGAVEQINALLLDMKPAGMLVPERKAANAAEMREAMQALGLGVEGMDSIVGGGSDREKLDAITQAIQAEHEHRNEHLHLGNLISDMVVGGLAVEKIFWNDDERIVDAKQLYPLDVAFDPDCRNRQLRGCKFIAVRHKADVEDVIERFELPRRVADQLRHSAVPSVDGVFNDADIPMVEAYDNLYFTESGGQEMVGGGMKRDKIEFYELYYLGERSFSAEHSKVPTGELSAGRVACVTKELERPLYDGENPDPKGECPLVLYQNYGYGHSPYTYGEVEPNLGNQIALNIIMSAMAMNSVLNQNAQWIVEEGVLTKDDLDNRPGGVFEVASNKINRVQRLPGIEIPSSMFALAERLDDAIMDVLNINDTTLGGTPQTHTPAYALQMAQSMNLARMRKKGESLEASWRRRTRLEANLYIAFAALLRQRGELHQDLGEFLRLGDQLSSLRFDVKIVSKTERPVGFIGEMQFALEAFKSGMIDKLGVANFVTDYPIDPELKELFRVQRENELLNARMQNTALRAQQQQAGMAAQQASSGVMTPTVGAGPEPATPEEAGVAPQVPMQAPVSQPGV